MTPGSIFSAIMGYIQSSWATATSICYPNRHFDIPDSDWIRPTIKMGETFYGELGDNGIGMRTGILMISIFGLQDQGSQILLTHASRLECLFRRKKISGIVFNEPSTDVLGKEEETGFYHVMVSVDFTTWVGEV